MNDTARARIRTLVESTDGFYISEMDLKLRGAGEFFGTRQSGLPSLRVANILRDGEILEIARREAVDFIAHPPDPEDLRRAVAYIRDHWQRRFRAMPRVPRRTACARRSSISWRGESKA
jgi:ATP-dependent DNA helicase RecG